MRNRGIEGIDKKIRINEGYEYRPEENEVEIYYGQEKIVMKRKRTYSLEALIRRINEETEENIEVNQVYSYNRSLRTLRHVYYINILGVEEGGFYLKKQIYCENYQECVTLLLEVLNNGTRVLLRACETDRA